LAAVGSVALADANAALAGGAVQGDVRHGDRHFLRQSAALLVAPAGPHVAIDAIDALDNNLILVGQHAQHAGGNASLRCAGVIAGDHFHYVVFANVHDKPSLLRRKRRLNQTTSAARLTIFRYPLSRSSRATAPKIRVPFGLSSSLLRMTIALRSKRT